ncbi:MAG: hypothetical protein KDA33_08580, partial [Phycisphaerales bacterium]|nr:hypothetical protein [Phycisphaerales bacterium]
IKGLPEQPSLLCVVRNCVHVNGATHRVGVKFERAVPKKGAAGGAAAGPRPDASNGATPAT